MSELEEQGPQVYTNQDLQIPPIDTSLQPEGINNDVPLEKKSKLKYLVSSVVSFLLILSLSFGYFFWWVPSAQAKEYIEETSTDFAQITQQLSKNQKTFDDISESFATSKEAFSEVAKTRFYFDAVEDTKQDIKEINKTLELLMEAKKTRLDLKVPKSLEEFDRTLDEYYLNIEDGMKLLLEFEQFQDRMHAASGDELNLELGRLNTEYTREQSTQKVFDYLANLSKLAGESAERLEIIDITPPLTEEELQIQIQYHRDLQQVTSLMSQQLSIEGSKEKFAQLWADFGLRNLERNKLMKQYAADFSSNSPIKIYLEKADELALKIEPEFVRLKEKYSLQNQIAPSPSPQTESTSSAQPESTSSAESSTSAQ